MAWWDRWTGRIGGNGGTGGGNNDATAPQAPPSAAGSGPADHPAPAPTVQRHAWQDLPPLRPVLSATPPVAPLESFTRSLTTAQNPSFLAPLTHLVDPRGPAGHVGGLTSPVPPQSISPGGALQVARRSPTRDAVGAARPQVQRSIQFAVETDPPTPGTPSSGPAESARATGDARPASAPAPVRPYRAAGPALTLAPPVPVIQRVAVIEPDPPAPNPASVAPAPDDPAPDDPAPDDGAPAHAVPPALDERAAPPAASEVHDPTPLDQHDESSPAAAAAALEQAPLIHETVHGSLDLGDAEDPRAAAQPPDSGAAPAPAPQRSGGPPGDPHPLPTDRSVPGQPSTSRAGPTPAPAPVAAVQRTAAPPTPPATRPVGLGPPLAISAPAGRTGADPRGGGGSGNTDETPIQRLAQTPRSGPARATGPAAGAAQTSERTGEPTAVIRSPTGSTDGVTRSAVEAAPPVVAPPASLPASTANPPVVSRLSVARPAGVDPADPVLPVAQRVAQRATQPPAPDPTSRAERSVESPALGSARLGNVERRDVTDHGAIPTDRPAGPRDPGAAAPSTAPLLGRAAAVQRQPAAPATDSGGAIEPPTVDGSPWLSAPATLVSRPTAAGEVPVQRGAARGGDGSPARRSGVGPPLPAAGAGGGDGADGDQDARVTVRAMSLADMFAPGAAALASGAAVSDGPNSVVFAPPAVQRRAEPDAPPGAARPTAALASTLPVAQRFSLPGRDLISSASSAVSNTVGSARNAVSGAADTARGYADTARSTAGGAVESARSTVGGYADQARSAAGGYLDSARSTVGGYADQARSTAGGLLESASSAGGGYLDSAGSAAGGLLSSARSAGGGYLDSATSAAGGYLDSARSAAGGALDSATSTAGGYLDSARSTVGGLADQATGAATGLVDRAGGAVGGIANDAAAAGQGALEGAQGAVGGAVDAAGSAASGLGSAATGALGAAAGAAAGAAGAAANALPTDLDELSRRLFDSLSARFRNELWMDRERAGLVTDLRR